MDWGPGLNLNHLRNIFHWNRLHLQSEIKNPVHLKQKSNWTVARLKICRCGCIICAVRLVAHLGGPASQSTIFWVICAWIPVANSSFVFNSHNSSFHRFLPCSVTSNWNKVEPWLEPFRCNILYWTRVHLQTIKKPVQLRQCSNSTTNKVKVQLCQLASVTSSLSLD